jgi:hypothetical protein
MTLRTLGYTALMILFTIMLVGCAARFDSNEYARMVDIRMELSESRCADDADARVMSLAIDRHVSWLSVYSQHLPDNSNTRKMIESMKRSTDEFRDRYAQSQSPSVVYCRLKVRAMQDQVDIILKTTARRER